MSLTKEEIISRVPDADKKEYCQFYIGTKEKFCLATSTRSCSRCPFFAPWITEQMVILTEAVNKEIEKQSALEGQIKKLKKTIDWQKELLENPEGGQWISEGNLYICSECKAEFRDGILAICNYRLPHYCPDCGAKMLNGVKEGSKR